MSTKNHPSSFYSIRYIVVNQVRTKIQSFKIENPSNPVLTSEHSLRYKQDKPQSFVAGTVLSLNKDGSKPVDGSYRNDTEEEEKSVLEMGLDSFSTIYSGRPG